MLTKDELPACPVATTLMLIGNKWKIFIVQRLLDRPWRFNELQKDIPGISQRVLTDNLRSMEEDGIITSIFYDFILHVISYKGILYIFKCNCIYQGLTRIVFNRE